VPRLRNGLAEGEPSANPLASLWFNSKAPSALEDKKMEDFPIWLKLVIWGTIGLTVGYTIWGMLSSIGHT
jgi:hypothetical protein